MRRGEAEGRREIGICQVWRRRKTIVWNEEQGCLGVDRKTSVLGDKDRNPYRRAALCRAGRDRKERRLQRV